MAWNPNSSPWGIWDSEGVFSTCHGHSRNSELQNELISSNNSNSSDTATTLCLDGYGVSFQRSKVPEENASLVVSALADKKDDQGSEVSGGVAFSNGDRIPIVTTCIGAIEYLVTSNNIGRSIGDKSQGSFHDNWAEIGFCPSLKIMPASDFVNHIDNLNGDDDDDDDDDDGVKMVDLMLNADEQGHPYRVDADDADDVVNECKGFIHGDDADDVVNEFESSYRQDVSPGSEGLLTSLHLGKMKDVYPRWDLKPSSNLNMGKNPNLSPNLRGSCKPKVGLAGLQAPPCCQVQGCKLDLSSAKAYHCRHRVCEAHSKAVKVVVSNLEQRFCQQCSRFHVLAEFDEAKRSCRRRLAEHNKRRRKPQPDPLEFTFGECHLLQEHPRFPQITLWKGGWDYQAGVMWPRHEDNHPMHPIHYSHVMQTPSMERKEFIDDLSPSIHHDKLPLLFQNPKAIEEPGISYAKDQHHHHYPRHHQRHQENEPHHHHHHHDLPDPVTNNGQAVSSSSSSSSSSFSLSQLGNCSFSATEITPVKTTHVQPRVNDSGRALSLLSLQTHGTTHGAISPHHPCPHHQALHWNHHHEDMVPHQHWNGLCVEHAVVRSTALSFHMHSSEDMELKQDGKECSYMHDVDGFEGSDHRSTASLVMQGYGKMKRTRDLCSFSSVSNTATSQFLTTGSHRQSDCGGAVAAAAFQLQIGSLGDIKCSNRTMEM